MVSTHLKNISQIGSSPQVGVKIKNIWNHHLVNVEHLVVDELPKKRNGATKKTKHLCYRNVPSWRSQKLSQTFLFFRANTFFPKQPKKNPEHQHGNLKHSSIPLFLCQLPPPQKKKLQRTPRALIQLPTINIKLVEVSTWSYNLFPHPPSPGKFEPQTPKPSALAPISTNWALEASVSASTRLRVEGVPGVQPWTRDARCARIDYYPPWN